MGGVVERVSGAGEIVPACLAVVLTKAGFLMPVIGSVLLLQLNHHTSYETVIPGKLDNGRLKNNSLIIASSYIEARRDPVSLTYETVIPGKLDDG